MPAFVIVQGTITDVQQYEHYKGAAAPTVIAAGGSYLVRGGATTSLEGDDAPQRTVVLQFDSSEAAVAWYSSESYQHARTLREGAAQMRLYVVDGA